MLVAVFLGATGLGSWGAASLGATAVTAAMAAQVQIGAVASNEIGIRACLLPLRSQALFAYISC
jgi:hypothetical protein